MAPRLVRLDFVILTYLVTFSAIFLFSDVLLGTGSCRHYTSSSAADTHNSLPLALRSEDRRSDCIRGVGGEIELAFSKNQQRSLVEPPAGSGVAPGIPPFTNPFPRSENVTVEDLERTNPSITVLDQAIRGNVSILALADEAGGDANNGGVESFGNNKKHQREEAEATKFAKASALDNKIKTIMKELYDETAVFSQHDAYIIIRRAFQNALLQSRRKFMIEAARESSGSSEGGASSSALSMRQRTHCFQFARDDQTPRDAISRIPCIPWNSERLHTVAMGRYGVLSTYHHVDSPTHATLKGRVTAGEKPTGRPPLRIGVAMSGQMRTYRRCYKTVVENVLKTNEALLFIASYPDVGDKRFGVRIEERDDKVDAGEVAHMFAPFLAGMYTADLPTVTRRLHGEFPTLMVTTQHSWMLYQLFMMDLAHTILLRHPLGPMWTDGVYSPFVINKGVPSVGSGGNGVGGSVFSSTPWQSFDVVVRIRPDLYILGPMWIRSLSPTSAVFNFSCGNHVFSQTFTSTEVLRTPHNPYYRWVLDPISDHSAIGFTDQVTSLFELYKDARAMEPSQQEREIFFHGNTVERMWTQHIARKKLTAIEVFGWHFMLRHPTKFLNSTNLMSNSERRRKLMMNIFAISDPSTVQCPPIDGKMWVLPPKKKGR